MRDTGNVSQINAVVGPPRRRAVDRRVARGLDAAVRAVRQELADDAQEGASETGGDAGLSAPQVRYLAAMRQRPSVGCAMRMAGVRFANLRQWRQCARFRELEAEAVEVGKGVLFAAAWNAAVIGWLEPVYCGGVLCGHRRRYSDRMRELLLKALFPHLFDKAAPAVRPPAIVLASPEQIAEVVRRLSPTARRIE